MRIGQLARKLEVNPSQIMEYLNELGFELDKGVNTKLMQGGINKVIDKFGSIDNITEEGLPKDEPPYEDAVTQVPDASIEIEEEQEEPFKATEKALEGKKETEIEEEEPIVIQESASAIVNKTEEEDVEVIRPELIKLQGLKVMGKIDLPEPKPKEAVEKQVETPLEESSINQEKPTKKKQGEEHIITEAEIKADIRRVKGDHDRPQRTYRKKVRKPRPKRKVLTYEEKLEKEKLMAEKRKIELEKKKKEQRKRNYELRMKTDGKAAPKKAKKGNRETVQPTQEVMVAPPKLEKPKTLAGKFWRWLNT